MLYVPLIRDEKRYFKKIIYFFTAPGCEAVVYNDSKVVL